MADDGGSSGRIRRELGLLPPGDLRMALAALAGTATRRRRCGARCCSTASAASGALAGHPVGNLMLAGLLETGLDPVAALADGRPTDRRGRTGAADEPGAARSGGRGRPPRSRRARAQIMTIRGQSSIAGTPGRVRSDPASCRSGLPPAPPPSTPSARPTSSCSGPDRGSPASSRTCCCTSWRSR